MKLLVRNLNRNITEVKLKSLFKKFGVIASSTLVIDEKTKKSKGFGFVEMADSRDGEKAIKALDNTLVEGNKIKVKAVVENDEVSNA